MDSSNSRSFFRRLAFALGVLFLVGNAGCGSSNDAPTGCAALSACCAALSSAEAQSCQNAVKMSGASDAQCNQALDGFRMSGLCGGNGGGDAGGSGDGGGQPTGDSAGGTDTGAGADGSVSAGCAALSACCPDVPVAGDPMACWSVAQHGTSQACAESLATYASAGYCAAPAVDAGNDAGSDAIVGGAIRCYETMTTGSSETCIEVVSSMSGFTCASISGLVGMTLDPGGCPSSGLFGCCLDTAMAGVSAAECYYDSTLGSPAESSCTGTGKAWSKTAP